MTRIEDQLIRTRKILISLKLAFMMVVMLISSIDITTVQCTKCGEAWKMFACEVTDEDKEHYICPSCKEHYICPSCENAKYRR